jgi:SAM-dependent methyltransferase
MAWFRRRKATTTATVMAPPSDRRMSMFGGRRHLTDAPYVLPKDMGEVKRLDFQHFLLRNGLQGNYAAPIQRPASILDVGCGTGRWAMEMATLFPQANVVGVDLVPTEEVTFGYGLERRPDNYVFVQGNILEGLSFATATFDLVHERLLIAALPAAQWPGVVSELVRVTARGGWVELAECGVPVNGGPGLMTMWGSWIELCKRRGIDFTLGHTIGDKLKAAGLADVQLRQVNFPMGRYGGRVGVASATDCLAVGKALRAGVIGMGIMPEPEYDRVYALAEREFQQPRGQGYLPFYVACGRRTL